MLPESTLFLFSCNPWISYVIGEEYYSGEHFVWCSPIFDAQSLPAVSLTQPPTSTPKEIYLSLLAEVSRGDRHSLKIASLREGLIRGAVVRHSMKELNDSQLAEIKDIVSLAETRDFRPLLYIVSFEKAKGLVKPVEVGKRAHPLSPEFVIERLPRSSFEVLDFC